MCVCYLGNPHGHDPLIEAGLILSTQVFDVFTLLLDLRVLSKEKMYITRCSTDKTQSKTGLIRSYRCSTDKTQSKTGLIRSYRCSTDKTQSKTGLIRSYRCSTEKKHSLRQASSGHTDAAQIKHSLRQASSGHRRGSWNLPEIGTLEIHNLTLHYCVFLG